MFVVNVPGIPNFCAVDLIIYLLKSEKKIRFCNPDTSARQTFRRKYEFFEDHSRCKTLIPRGPCHVFGPPRNHAIADLAGTTSETTMRVERLFAVL